LSKKNRNVGFVVVNPPEEVIQDYSRIQKKIKTHQGNLETRIAAPPETEDGHRFKRMANIGNAVDFNWRNPWERKKITSRTFRSFQKRSWPSQTQSGKQNKTCKRSGQMKLRQETFRT
jgi:hypothetical protein